MATNVSNQNPVVQVNETANKEPNVAMVNLVDVENNQVVTTSLRIADIFGKQHKNVLRDIQNLECSDDFRKLNFEPSHIIKQLPNNGSKELPMYYLTRDGFMFLVMGFTGKTAAKWKEAYIKAFNDMEAKIRAEQLGEQVKKAIEERDQKEYEEYLEQVRQEDEREYQHDKEVDKWHENRLKEEARKKAEEAKAQAQTEEQQPTAEQQPIVEVVDGKRVISSRTLATLTGRRHGDVMDSVQRMFKYSSRPSRMFIKSDDWAKKTNCLRAKRCYYITVGGFALLCKHTWSIGNEVHRLVLAAFGNNTGLSREQLALPHKPTKPKAPTTPPTPTTKAETKTEQPPTPTAQTQAPTVASMPQTPADLMQRFVKAMGVMMGVDTKEMFNLMDKGE